MHLCEIRKEREAATAVCLRVGPLSLLCWPILVVTGECLLPRISDLSFPFLLPGVRMWSSVMKGASLSSRSPWASRSEVMCRRFSLVVGELLSV